MTRHLCTLLAVAGVFTVSSAWANFLEGASSVRDPQNSAVFSKLNAELNDPSGAAISWEDPPGGNDDGYFERTDSVPGAFSRSNAGLSFASASSSTSIGLHSQQSLVLSGAPGETVTLNLRSFMLRDQATLTLEGTATTSFVINVTKQFSLSGSSKIVLAGGLQCDHVFFNVLGTGPDVSMRGTTSLIGMLTASQRTVRLRGHAIVSGQVVANNVVLRGAATIVPCPMASP